MQAILLSPQLMVLGTGAGKRKMELRDMMLYLERDPMLRKSPLLYKALLRAHEEHSRKLTQAAAKSMADKIERAKLRERQYFSWQAYSSPGLRPSSSSATQHSSSSVTQQPALPMPAVNANK